MPKRHLLLYLLVSLIFIGLTLHRCFSIAPEDGTETGAAAEGAK